MNVVWRIEELKVYAEQLEIRLNEGKLDGNTAFDKLKNSIDLKYKHDVEGTWP